MKAITFNLIMQIQLFILAMQEWSERQWKEVISPSISQLFAQAKKDMEEGKPLPEMPKLPEETHVNTKELKLMSDTKATLLLFGPLLLGLCYELISKYITSLPVMVWQGIGCILIASLLYLVFNVTRYQLWIGPKRKRDMEKILSNFKNTK